MHVASLQSLSALLAHAKAGTIVAPQSTAVRAVAVMSAAPPPAAPPPPPAAGAPEEQQSMLPVDADDVIVQAIVVRRDLLKDMSWPVGSVMSQACHACLAVAWEHRDDPCVAAYLAPGNIDSMHKVVKECKGEPQVSGHPFCIRIAVRGVRVSWPCVVERPSRSSRSS